MSKDILRLSAILLVICGIAAACVGTAHDQTAPLIEAPGDFDEFAHGDPNQIRTAPHRYRSLQNTQRLVLDFQRPGPELESLSGRASRRPDPLVSRTAVTTPILRCAAGHRGRPYRFSNRHSVSRSEFAPGNFRFRLPHPQIWVFMRNGFRQKNRFFAHLLMCSL